MITDKRTMEVNDLCRQFTDEELLQELRLRKRFDRIGAEHIIEGWRRQFGSHPPREYVIERLCKEIGYEIGKKILNNHIRIPGMKEQEGRFERYPSPPCETNDIRYFIPLNFVVEKR